VGTGQANPKDVVERLRRAMNAHDLEAHVACFHPDYRSEQPAHPNRGFGGREQVEKNWTSIYGTIPDFHAELLAITARAPAFSRNAPDVRFGDSTLRLLDLAERVASRS
jgi:SnoaL-like domain